MKKSRLAILSLTLIIAFASLYIWWRQEERIPTDNPQISVEELEKPEKPEEIREPRVYNPPETIEIQISGVGDIMVHSPQIPAQFNPITGNYDFHNNFQYVAPYLREADLALGNLETTFRGPEVEYAGYPAFNTPDALADALKSAGFDGLATANNHTYDTGEKGIIRTVEVLKERNLLTFGTRRTADEEGFAIIDIKGIKVGLTAYTYETPMVGGRPAINGILLSSEAEALIDTFSYERLQEDLPLMKERIEILKERGAEIIVFYIHWGHEYHQRPSHYQREIAKELANYGVDILFGSHPHVIQPIEIIKTQDGEHETVVVYSMGNFISNQRLETIGNPRTEDGIIVNVTLSKNITTQDIRLKELTYTPTWVHKYYSKGKPVYEILPLPEVIIGANDYALSQEELNRATNSQRATRDLIESEIFIKIANIINS
ncbi:CapA family protein [Alkaliphilus serpentinus]|uniref:CapA family protein n=1 Tax=Alkaliphilus serpentinus TaxID=1482731 RepID=A0A833HNC9_9FIRM|nr:CapA family protein [Alkaliphilus serpentinus]KAB3529265.1 CapA family protein [Alkaliphilus serpentinus]